MGQRFSELRGLFENRALMTLTDDCPSCQQVGHVVAWSGDARCAACHVFARRRAVSMAECFSAVRRHVAAQGQGHAYVCIVGARAFFLCVSDGLCVAHDSHKRTWVGEPSDGSSCLTVAVRWRDGLALEAISKIWRRGSLGYSETDDAALWTWGGSGTGTPLSATVIGVEAEAASPAAPETAAAAEAAPIEIDAATAAAASVGSSVTRGLGSTSPSGAVSTGSLALRTPVEHGSQLAAATELKEFDSCPRPTAPAAAVAAAVTSGSATATAAAAAPAAESELAAPTPEGPLLEQTSDQDTSCAGSAAAAEARNPLEITQSVMK